MQHIALSLLGVARRLLSPSGVLGLAGLLLLLPAGALSGCTGTPGVQGDGDGDGDLPIRGDGDGDGDPGDGDGDGDGGDGDGDGDGDPGDGDGDGDGGDGDGDGDIGDGDGDAIPVPPFQQSTRGKLVWKRTRTLEADVMGALGLSAGEVCNELGLFNCTRSVHLVALGGNEPFGKALYTPLASPSVTTSVAVDRVVLSACAFAAQRDADNPGAKQVFTALDLTANPVVDGATIDATLTELYHRFHARDPLPEEIQEVKDLLVDDDGVGISALDFAKLSCFAVGTTTEFVFY